MAPLAGAGAGVAVGAGSGVEVAGPVIGTAGALVAGAGAGVAEAQAETSKAIMVRLKNTVFDFIRSSEQDPRQIFARVYEMVLGI